jgi:hypothetical protein
MGFSIIGVSKGLDRLGRELDQLSRNIERLNRQHAEPTIDVDTKKAEAKVGAFARDLQSKVERAVRSLPDIKLGADASAADRRIQEIRRQLAALSDKRVGIDIDAATANAQINRLSAELSRLSRQSASLQVRADTAKAAADLQGVSALARRVDGQRVAISVNASDVSRAISLLGLLTAALAGASALVGPAAAGIAALGPLSTAGAQGIGALAAGFSGVGDAVKALNQAETKAAAGTATSAASRVNSAQAIASAQRAVQRAVEQSDRAGITGAQQVADARRSLAAAQVNAAQQTAAAEQSLAGVQQSAADAQKDLTRARADEVERLQDLKISAAGAALDVDAAWIRLKRAKQAMDEGAASGVAGLDLAELDLAYRQAVQGLTEATDRAADLREEQARSSKAGVEGSDQVQAAHRRVAETAEQVQRAEKELAQTRSDGAAQVAQAQEQVQRAVQQASWAQQDAAASIADAQRALSNAYQDTGTQGAASLNKVKEALEGLSPEAQHFAHFLVDEVIPGLHGIRDAVQATLLPRMETALRNMGRLAPVISAGLAETGKVIGDLSIKGSEMMSSGPWQRDFATIMSSNNRALGSFGEAGLSIADAFRSITVAAGPMLERFARFAGTAAQAFDSFITGKRATGELDEFFSQMSDTLAELGHIAGQIITSFLRISQAMGPLGMVLLRTLGDLVQWVGELAAAHPAMTQLIGVLAIGAAAFSKLGVAMAGIVALKGTVLGGWTAIGAAINALAPAAVATRLSGVQRGMEAAALSAGVFTEKMTGSAAAGERVATAGGKFASAATKIGGALPVVVAALIGVTLATDALNSSFDEMAAGMAQGGIAVERMRAELARNDAEMERSRTLAGGYAHFLGYDWARAHLAGVQSTDEFNRKLAEQRESMTALQRASYDAGVAQGNYQLALDRFGPTSWQAATAGGALALATQQVKEKQDAAAEAAKSLTDKLIEQRNAMLGNFDAEIRYQAAVDALSASVAANGATLDLNTAAGRANRQALNEMTNAAGAHLQAMADNGAGLDAVTAKEREYRDQLFNAAVQAGYSREAARAYVDQLYLTPKNISTQMHLDTGPATRALHDWIVSAQGKQFAVEVTGNITAGAVRRASGGPIHGPGTTTSDSILARLSNDEHVWSAREVRGAGGHQRVAHLRSAAASGQLPRFALGGPVRRIPGFAAGGVIDDDSFESNDLLDPNRGRPGYTQAEDGSWVAPGYYRELATESAKAAEVFDGRFNPAMKTQSAAGEDLTAALQRLTGQLPLLTTATTLSGTQIQTTWARNTAAVTAAQQQQTAQQNILAANHASATARMTAALAGMQGRHAASWQAITAQSGASIGAITGPQFGGLHRGMDLVQGHSTNMANWVGGQYARLRGLTADPIRWALDFPINRGLVPAWGAIDRFFALGRPMGPVPVGFARGTEDHRAQIARPGQMRIWNEPETHGEAYIPLARTKRGRSTKILGAVADEFGYALEPKFYADGGLWRQMFGIVKGQFPSATLNSAYRPGDPGYHGKGKATDLGGPMLAIDRWLASRFPNSTELIHTPGINLWHGAPHVYNAATRAEHFSHVHWAMENAGMLGAQAAAGAMGATDVRGMIEPYFNDTRRMVADIHRFHGPGNMPAAMTRMGNDAVSGAIGKASELMATAVAPGAGAGVQRWRPVGLRALAIEGQPASEWSRMAMQMQSESGGNPTAVNRRDINWQRGQPSVGLMQVIGPTYRTHRHPQFDTGPYMYGTSVNPLSNILASTRYTLSRYGSLAAGWKGQGYDLGGILRSGRFGVNTSGRPERILSPAQTAAFERLVDVLNTHRGLAPVVLSSPQQPALSGVADRIDQRAILGFIEQAVQRFAASVNLDGARLRIEDDGRGGIARIAQRQQRDLNRSGWSG